MVICSPEIQRYFDELDGRTKMLHGLAQKAREKNLDPESYVDIPLAANVAQRCEALVSSVAPQLAGSGVHQRITELEGKYGAGDWRVALIVSDEVAQEKFCKFKDLKEKAEVGTRIGLAYLTLGSVSAPLEGLVEVKLKKRKDGKDYLALYFAGPIRASGGTAIAVSILVADYVRRNLGIADYDMTDEELKRYQVEIDDYLHRLGFHRQYVPSPQELELMLRSIKLEITGDPTEKFEVSQCRHLERVETDLIRGGMALVLTEGPSLKASKLWKNLSKWGKDFGLDDWRWLEDFIKLKEKLHSTKKEIGEVKTVPINTYLADIVAGRPVFGYPMTSGAFRLRYGRSRLSGFAATCIHPATMQILQDYIATGTQLKVERPGKATVISPCDTIEGPIVKLEDGSVLKLHDETEARKIRNKIAEILYLGDMLNDYGNFSENGMKLAPAGYCEEWWEGELAKATSSQSAGLSQEIIDKINIATKNQGKELSFEGAIFLSEKLNIPLHPRFTYFWNALTNAEFLLLFQWFKKLWENELPLDSEPKRALELIGCPHRVRGGKVVIDEPELSVLKYFLSSENFSGKDGLDCVNSISKIKIQDKAGTFIGTRMGRPEKAKLRKLKGSPHGLFPCGKQGGRLRCFQEVISHGHVESEFPIFECESCKNITVYPSCEKCGSRTVQWRVCPLCKKKVKQDKCHADTKGFERRKLEIQGYVDSALKKIDMPQLPPLVKGVRGTWNKMRYLENFAKVLLRAKHNLYVNKDGTIRYDMTEMGLTHFKPKETGTSIEKLRELGYAKDIHGNPLENSEQVLELFPQDVILPACPESGDEGADSILIRVCQFVDELLVKLYGLEPFYNVKKKDDLIGQLVIGLAPHTSAGIIGRLIGFSRTQGCYAHPYWHAAQRRNLDGDETCVMMALDAFLNFSRQFLPDRRGGRAMDAPLVLTTILDPMEVDTEAHGIDVAWRYPVEFYEAALQCKNPGDVKIEQVKARLGKPEQYEGLGFTHDSSDMNSGVRVSSYKLLPTMVEKMEGQIRLAGLIRAVDLNGVAGLVIDKHFIRDIKGNLRKFTQQEFRCVSCNAKYRRPPMSGVCTACKGKLLFTIAEGSVKKYLEATTKLANMEGMPAYVRQTIVLLTRRIESIFGRDATKQVGLAGFMGS